MKQLLSYRTVIYAGTLATGMTGLIYQVVWQKYLTFIVGSDSRSVALVVAVFLAGLAAGYRFWGRSSERMADRRKLLRLYGALEIGIGLYAAVFLYWLEVVRFVAHHLPPWLVSDLLVAVLTLAGPTFLMGATIPLLVSVVPERPEEVHLAHAKIYGINTLGACLGAFASSFLLIPELGLPATLFGASALNLLVGTIFWFNPLRARVTRQETIPEIPNRFPVPTIYLYTLITGMVTLSLEVLLVRVLNLTIGAGPHNFAIIVGVFILGLALGSLAVTERMLSVKVLLRALMGLTLYLMVLFYTVPFWPYWVSNLRVLLRPIPAAYGVYVGGVTLLLVVLLLPFLVPLGFMLPLAYALLPKNTADYGKKCGWLYFYNTLGTALGAVVLSYVLLRYVNLDIVFKLDVALLGLLAVLMSVRERRAIALVVAAATVVFLAGPRWDRDSHYQGLYNYRDPAPYNYQGWFRTPRLVTEVEFFADGPDTTVTVATREPGTIPADLVGFLQPDPMPRSRALLNNGRSEGDTLGDYSTMVLAGILPYLHAPDRAGLEVAIVGLGTGLTAGVLGAGQDVGQTSVAEISRTLIDAARHFDEYNFGLARNSRVRILPVDGFRYFARLDGEVDIVVSEPSVPWVTGVENLFTPEYYRLADRALREDGVFMQWFPLYTIDAPQFRTILGNLGQVFPELRMFRLSSLEVGVIASHRPFSQAAVARRLAEPLVRDAAERLSFTDPAQLELIRLYDATEIRTLSRSGEHARHTLDHPSLSYASDRTRFLALPIDWMQFLDPRLERLRGYRAERGAALEYLVRAYPDAPCTQVHGGAELFCPRLVGLRAAWALWQTEQPLAVERRLQAYDQLRQEGFLPPSPEFLRAQASMIVERLPGAQAAGMMHTLLATCEKDGLWEEASAALELFREHGLLDDQLYANLMAGLRAGRQAYRDLLDQYRAIEPAFGAPPPAPSARSERGVEPASLPAT